MAAPTRPLSGVQVLELGGLAPSPYAGLVLADFGADVVRIDRPGASPLHTDILGGGRRSLVLDLKADAGREVFKRLADRADVVIDPFRPGVMERLGLGPDELLARNPRLVFARLTGWGQPPVAPPAPFAAAADSFSGGSENPDKPVSVPAREQSPSELARRWHGTAGHDSNYLAMSGALSLFGRAGQPPVPPMNVLGDFAAGGFLCAFGVLAALLEREKSGKGQVVDAAIADGAAYFSAWPAAQVALGMMTEDRGTNLLDTGAPFYDCYECADGKYVSVGSIEPQFYAALLQGLAAGAQVDTDALPEQHDRDNWPKLREVFTSAFRSRTRDEWAAMFAGTDACVVPILALSESGVHPYCASREMWVNMDEGRGGEKLRPTPAPRLSRTPARADCNSFPGVGSSSAAVLQQYGFTAAETAALQKAGTVGRGDTVAVRAKF
jgi:alpha-methylacyl-CoA racemase